MVSINSNPFGGWNPPETLAETNLPRMQVQEITTPLGQRNHNFETDENENFNANFNSNFNSNLKQTSTLQPVGSLRPSNQQFQNQVFQNQQFHNVEVASVSTFVQKSEIDNMRETLDNNPELASQFREYQQELNSSL